MAILLGCQFIDCTPPRKTAGESEIDKKIEAKQKQLKAIEEYYDSFNRINNLDRINQIRSRANNIIDSLKLPYRFISNDIRENRDNILVGLYTNESAKLLCDTLNQLLSKTFPDVKAISILADTNLNCGASIILNQHLDLVKLRRF